MHPDDWALHGRTYLDGTAADYMHTAMHALPATERTWATLYVTFCALLGTSFGRIDLDTEFWDQSKGLKQGSLPAAPYVHEMQYCFKLTELPISAGEKIQRFKDGLNPTLKRLVVTAPFGMGCDGKWLDPNQLMSYTVTQAQGLPHGGAVGPAAASPLVGQSGHKRSHDGNGIANAKGKKQKRKEISKHAGSNSGGKGKTGKPFRPNGEKECLIAKRLCLHCCKPSHQSFYCSKKKTGEPAAPMPAEFAKSAKA
ncbi:TPA: hypothetical protein ACH3X1_013282 [Trebouxia sp. C0004]